MLKLKISSGSVEDKVQAPDATPLVETPVSVSSEATTPGATSAAANGSQSEGAATPTPKQENPAKVTDMKETNLKALRHLASQMPNSLAPFFQCIVSLF